MDIRPAAVMKWRDLTSIDRALLFISIFAGIYYLIAPFAIPSEIRHYGYLNPIMKGLSVAPLALIAFHIQRDLSGMLLGLALAFGSLGDVLLERRGLFVYGLISFLVGHLFYIALWAKHLKASAVPSSRKLVIAVLAIFLVLMLWWQLPVPGLSVPLTVYMCVLTLMAVLATAANLRGNWVMIGAILFLISDSLIGIERFKHLIGGHTAGVSIWSTYYLAQYLLAFGYLGNSRK